jgi:hypothetical protein
MKGLDFAFFREDLQAGFVKSVLYNQRLDQAKSKAPLRGHTGFLPARGIGCASATGGSESRANQRSVAPTRQDANERTSASSAADHGQVALFVRASLDEDAGSLQLNLFTPEIHAGKGKAQVSGILQPTRSPDRDHVADHFSSPRHDDSAFILQIFSENCVEVIAGGCCAARNRGLQSDRYWSASGKS